MNAIRKFTAALALGATLALPALAQDKVTIYSAAPQDLLDQVVPAFEKSSRLKVEVIKGGSGDLVNRLNRENLAAGEEESELAARIAVRTGKPQLPQALAVGRVVVARLDDVGARLEGAAVLVQRQGLAVGRRRLCEAVLLQERVAKVAPRLDIGRVEVEGSTR